MIWLIFYFTTIIFGFNLINFIKQKKNFTLIFQICISWLIGSLLTGIYLNFILYFFSLNYIHSLIIIFFQLILSYYFNYLNKKNINLKIFLKKNFNFEELISLYFLILISLLIIIFFLISIYNNFPLKIIKNFKNIFQIEFSFINSIIYGINKNKKNFFYFKDPEILNKFFPYSTIPLLYSSIYIVLGSNYESISFLISLSNIICTTVAIYFYFSFFLNINIILLTIFYFFHSGIGFFFIPFNNNNSIDYMYNLNRRNNGIIYNLFTFHLTCWKESSYTIPLTLFTLIFLQNNSTILYGFFLSILIPNNLTLISLYIYLFNFPLYFKKNLLFSLIIFFKILYFNIIFKNLWFEYQLKGYFYSQLLIIFDSFGIFFITFFLINKLYLHKFLFILLNFIFLLLFRQGNSLISTSTSFYSLIFPNFLIIFLNYFQNLYKNIENKIYLNVFKSLIIIFIIQYIYTGLSSIKRSIFIKEDFYLIDNKLIKWFQENSNQDSLIFSNIEFNPLSFFLGKQLFCGSLKILWEKGFDPYNYLKIIRNFEINNSFIELNKFDYFLLNKEIQINNNNCTLKFQNNNLNIYKC